MPLVPGLSPSLRQAAPNAPANDYTPEDIIIEQDGGDKHEVDDRGNVIKISHPDGSVTISLDGRPLNDDGGEKKDKGWFENLIDDIDDHELGRIAEDLLRGVRDDIQSRTDWIEERARGIRLLGLKVEVPGTQGAADGAPIEGMSKVRHPLLQEAVLRFQANARSELLPTDGPAKIRNDSNNSTLEMDTLSNALEKDFNHYLTATATEYYPDTDRMLFMLGFGGTCFKKVYFCPIRNRPVSESVDADDLIVNEAATDLKNARRVTHRVMMPPSTVKRMQILGVYRDIELGYAIEPEQDAVQLEKKNQQGITRQGMRQDDRDREIFECYCELDIKGFEHKKRGSATGLEIPYRVTIDVSSRQILSITRNYNKDTKDLPEPRTTFVKYTFVPGMGFYDLGLLHILGNTTSALTAAWRELLDSGMYANFPGFLVSDIGGRQNTNIFRIPPGGGAILKTGGQPINQVAMPMPYNTQGAPALMALVQDMATTGQRVGGTSEQPVGEGKQDAPVGTTLALIEQATKILNSVHKRMHAAQAEELQLLKECFRENPDSFWQKKHSGAYPWDETTFLQALEDCNLVPQADPNTASQVQRLMKMGALMALQAASPSLYDPIAINIACIKALGFSNPEQFMAPPSAMGTPPPELVKMQQEGQAKLQEAQAKTDIAKAKAAEVQSRHQIEMTKMHIDANKPGEAPKGPEPLEEVKARAMMLDAQTRAKGVDAHHAELALSEKNQALDRQSKEHIELMNLAKEVFIHQHDGQREQERMQFEGQHKEADRALTAEQAKEAAKAKANKPAKPKGEK